MDSQIDADEKADASYPAYSVTTVFRFQKARKEMVSHYAGTLDQSLVRHDVEYRQSRSGRYRITAECVEVARIAEARQMIGPRYDAVHWKAVPHRFAHRHDIGKHAVARKSPHARTGSSETWLNFIGNEHPARLANRFDRRR
ncbi:hypothetical protein AGR4C_Cc160165 [Agrobacterium tumefaciens str. Kerr 14]|uniref:Uncharacterized protein n=2 Tax=Agrobacterium TaxID=357 RepID=A0A1S7R9Y4_9HYPH|nr:hypothetical protein At12D1_22050 [Agrobacterium tumefaciens]CUX17138.1 hypothetical protein AGR4C_Cc160165 [Agrobacterium tumefaciens str. Kerr 14]CUX49161.1 hypothetical protein AGR7C_Lc140084 [Agrobacterium deltaense Zutra 3/1]